MTATVVPKRKHRTTIYALVNKKSGRKYVGATSQTFSRRKYAHLDLLRRGSHYSKELQSDFTLLGEDAFKFIKLETCDPADRATIELVHIIEAMNGAPGVYNTIQGKTTISRLRGATPEERESILDWLESHDVKRKCGERASIRCLWPSRVETVNLDAISLN